MTNDKKKKQRKKDKNFGQVYKELHENEAPNIELGNFNEIFWQEWQDHIEISINDGLKRFTGDFFIEVRPKRQELMPDIDRNKWFVRKTCPTPHCNQTVYWYKRKNDKLEFLWILPELKECKAIRDNVLLIDPEYHALRDHVVDFFDGTLLKLAMQLNNENIYDDAKVLKEIYG